MTEARGDRRDVRKRHPTNASHSPRRSMWHPSRTECSRRAHGRKSGTQNIPCGPQSACGCSPCSSLLQLERVGFCWRGRYRLVFHRCHEHPPAAGCAVLCVAEHWLFNAFRRPDSAVLSATAVEPGPGIIGRPLPGARKGTRTVRSLPSTLRGFPPRQRVPGEGPESGWLLVQLRNGVR